MDNHPLGNSLIQPAAYAQLVDDIAARVVELLTRKKKYISQNEAFRRYGRANVERWRRNGQIEPCKRTRKLEYEIMQLDRLQRGTQDYLY